MPNAAEMQSATLMEQFISPDHCLLARRGAFWEGIQREAASTSLCLLMERVSVCV